MIAGSVLIGSGFTNIVATRHLLIGRKDLINRVDREFWRYDGTPNAWTKIAGSEFYVVAANDADVFGWKIDATLHRFTGEPGVWEQIGTGAYWPYAGVRGLVAPDWSTRVLSSWDPVAKTWTRLGGPQPGFSQFWATDGTQIARNNGDSTGASWMELWNSKTGNWTKFGDHIIAVMFFNGYLLGWKYQNALTPNDTFDSIQRLDPGGGWTLLTREQLSGQNVVMRNQRLLAMTIRGKLMTCANPRAPVPVMTELSDDDPNVTSIAATSREAFVNGPSGCFQIPNPMTDERSLQTRDPGKTRWLVAATTADKAFAGYSGNMYYNLSVDGQVIAGIIPLWNFNRGTTVWFEVDVPSTLKVLQNVSLWGDMGLYIDDRWTISGLSFLNPDTKTYFNYNQETTIGDGVQFMSDLGEPNVTYPARTYQSGFVRVHVWQWRMKEGDIDQAIGHVAAELVDDGTYISWWPEAAKDAMSLAAKIDFPSNKPFQAMQPRTFADDLAGEQGVAPSYSFMVGGLDIAAIKTWWAAFKADPNNKYILLTQNCTTVVYLALKAGGALNRLTTAQRLFYESTSLGWTPWFMYKFIELINSQPVQTSMDVFPEP